MSSSSNVSCDNCPPYGAHYCYELNEARFYYSPSYYGDGGRMFYCDYAYSRYRDPFPFLYASRVSYEPIPYCKEYPFHIPEGGVEPLPSCARSDMYKTELCKHFIRTGRCKYGSKCQFAHGYSRYSHHTVIFSRDLRLGSRRNSRGIRASARLLAQVETQRSNHFYSMNTPQKANRSNFSSL